MEHRNLTRKTEISHETQKSHIDHTNMAHKNLIWNTEISHETLKSHMKDKNLTCNIETSYETQKMRPGRRQRRRPGPLGSHMKRTLETIHEKNSLVEMTRIHEITRILDMKCTDATPAAWSAPKAPPRTVWITHETYT